MRMPGDEWVCAPVLRFFNGKSLVSQSMERQPFRIGQNEIKRYKEKQLESTVAICGIRSDPIGTRGYKIDAAKRLFEKQRCVSSGC